MRFQRAADLSASLSKTGGAGSSPVAPVGRNQAHRSGVVGPFVTAFYRFFVPRHWLRFEQ
jgi:hypothetical protein